MFHRLFILVLALIPLLISTSQAGATPALQRALDAVFVIYSDDLDRAFLGSGFVWQPGLVLTNAHVVGDAETVLVRDRAGRRQVARVRAKDARRDIALLDLPGAPRRLEPAPNPAQIGDSVFALGAPLGLAFTVSRGIVAADPRQIDPTVPLRFLQHDAAINPGSSGGPLVDDQGRLLGMNSQIADGSRLFVGVSFAIARQDLARLVPQMLDNTLMPLALLGLDARPVSPKIAAALGIAETGVLIDDVEDDGVAAAANLRAGDVVLTVDGKALDRLGDLAFALEGVDKVALDVLRDGMRRQVVLDLPGWSPTAKAFAPPPEPLGLKDLSVDVDAAHRVRGQPGGAASGLLEDDEILRINGKPMTDDLLEQTYSSPIVLLVARDERKLHVEIDPWSSRQALHPLRGGNALDLSVRRF